MIKVDIRNPDLTGFGMVKNRMDCKFVLVEVKLNPVSRAAEGILALNLTIKMR